MKNSLFKVLSDYNLLKPQNRLQRLLDFNPVDYSNFLDSIQVVLPKWVELSSPNNDKPFDLWLPYPSDTSISEITNYSFLFEKVYLLDPMSDLCCFLEINDEQNNIFSRLGDEFGVSTNPIMKSLGNTFQTNSSKFVDFIRELSAKKLNKVIESYIQNKDLIDEGVVIPFIEPPTSIDPNAVLDFFVKWSKEQWENNISLRTLNKDLNLHPISFDEKTDILYKNQDVNMMMIDVMETWRFLLTTSTFKDSFPVGKAPNLDIGDEKNKAYINKIIELGTSVIGNNVDLLRNISWPTPSDELSITSINGIPSYELLEIRQKENAAIESFRYKTRVKLEKMRVSAQSDNYAGLIKSFQSEQKAQTSEVQLLFENIRKNHLRKISQQIGLMTFSAAGAILSALATTQNPMGLVGIGVAGAGLSNGISKLIETWTTYQSDMDKLREKDGYILWRIKGEHKNHSH